MQDQSDVSSKLYLSGIEMKQCAGLTGKMRVSKLYLSGIEIVLILY